MCAQRKGGEVERDARSIPFAIVVGEHALYGVSFERTDRRFFVVEEPKVLIGILVVVADGQCQVVGDAVVFDVECEVIYFSPFPLVALDGLELVVDYRLRACCQ